MVCRGTPHANTMVVFGAKTAKTVIDQIAANDKSLIEVDLTKNASYCMRSLENTQALCEALKANTCVKTLVLRQCEMVDAAAEALAEALAVNSSVEDLNLEQNHITTKGAITLAAGLAKNKGVRTLNLMNQSQKCMGDDALEQFINMFQSNLTLTKVMWKVDSRRAWELSKLITRNVEIQRRTANKASIEDLLPTSLRGTGATVDPPMQRLSITKLADVKAELAPAPKQQEVVVSTGAANEEEAAAVEAPPSP